MPDPGRHIGPLYAAFAVLLALGAAWYAVAMDGDASSGPGAYLLFASAGALAGAYAVVGRMLHHGAPGARPWAIGLAVVALAAFPLGTPLGAYAVWRLARRAPVRWTP